MSWSLGGRSLDTDGVTVISVTRGIPPVKGDNPETPLRTGRAFRVKQYDQRVITLGLLLSADDKGAYEALREEILALLGERRQQILSETLTNASVRSAWVDVTGAPNLTRISPSAAKIAVDFLMSDPLFYAGALHSQTFTVDASPKTITLNNPGNAPHRKAIITLSAPLQNVTLTNMGNGHTLSINGTLSGADQVVVDCGAYTATKTGNVNFIGGLAHSGDPCFLVLLPGNNVISIASAVMGGTIAFNFYPSYF